MILVLPLHPKLHGYIARMIRTVKLFMIKSPCDFYKALLIYRPMPLEPDTLPPAELFFDRQIPGNMPIVTPGARSNNYLVAVEGKQQRGIEIERYNA